MNYDAKIRVLKSFFNSREDPLAPFALDELYDFFEANYVNRNVARKFVSFLRKEGFLNPDVDDKVAFTQYFYKRTFFLYDIDNSLREEDIPHSSLTNSYKYDCFYASALDVLHECRNLEYCIVDTFADISTNRRKKGVLLGIDECRKNLKKSTKRLLKMLEEDYKNLS